MTAPLHTTITDGVAVVVLDSPHNRNSLGLLGIETLSAETERLGRDPAVDVIVLGHAGPAFSAGHDLREMQAADQAQLEELFHRSSALMQSLHALPQPVIARVDGVATMVDDDPELLHWSTESCRRYVGDDRADEFGRRNAASGEVLVRVRLTRLVGATGISN